MKRIWCYAPSAVHQEIPFDEFVEIEVVQLDESTGASP